MSCLVAETAEVAVLVAAALALALTIVLTGWEIKVGGDCCPRRPTEKLQFVERLDKKQTWLAMESRSSSLRSLPEHQSLSART